MNREAQIHKLALIRSLIGKKMKKYVKPQMKIYVVASCLLQGSSADIKTNPTEEGNGEVL